MEGKSCWEKNVIQYIVLIDISSFTTLLSICRHTLKKQLEELLKNNTADMDNQHGEQLEQLAQTPEHTNAQA